MFNWFGREKGSGGPSEEELFNEKIDRLFEGHSSPWKEWARAALQPLRSHIEIEASVTSSLDSVIAAGVALGYTNEFPRDQWRLVSRDGMQRESKSLSTINRDFRAWAQKKGFTTEETQRIFKSLAEMYFYDDIEVFTRDVRGNFAEEVERGTQQGKLSDHPEYVEHAFEQWRSYGPHEKKLLTEEEEQYLWNGIEAKLFEGQTIGGPKMKEDPKI